MTEYKYKFEDEVDFDLEYKINIKNSASISEDIKNNILNESVQSLKRSFIENGIISCVRTTEGGIMKVYSLTNIGRSSLYKFLKRGYTLNKKLQIPKCLYSFKEEIIAYIKKMARETNSVIDLNISKDVNVSIYGKEKDVNTGYILLLKYIQQFFMKDFKMVDGYFNFKENIENGGMLFYGSKIDNRTLLVSKDYILKENTIFSTYFRVDPAKYFFLSQFDSTKIENLLSRYNCYLETNIINNKICKFKLIGFNNYEISKCKNEILLLFFEINKLAIPLENVNVEDKMLYIKYKNNKMYTIIGYQDTLNNILLQSKNDCTLQIELDRELEDFLCGKKNGKINKIIKESGCNISLKNKSKDDSEIYFLISGLSTNVSCAIELLKLEYPEKLAFFLHEKHHKRIIGFGGKNIQKIMKKHGVYIKFMGEDERRDCGYNGNVIIKTPRKNVESLDKMKKEILLLADEEIEIEEKIEKKISYIDFYDFQFHRYKLEYKNVVVESDQELKPKYQKIYEKESAADGDIILKLKDGSKFLKRYGEVENEVNSIYWCSKDINTSFKLFNSYLFYTYEPFFYSDKISDEQLEFKDRDKNDISYDSRLTVGFQNDNNSTSMK